LTDTEERGFTADNHTELSRGHIAGVRREVRPWARDVRSQTASTVASIGGTGGPRELSVGYVTKTWTGPRHRAADGQAYELVQPFNFSWTPRHRSKRTALAKRIFRIGGRCGLLGGIRPHHPTSNPKEDTMSELLSLVVLGR